MDILDGSSFGSSEGASQDALDLACGLNDMVPLAPGDVGQGIVVSIGGELFDLGVVGDAGDAADAGGVVSAGGSGVEGGAGDAAGDRIAESVTLADDRGLSIYADTDGDGTVDHVTTVLFDGRWETWSQEAVSSAEAQELLASEHKSANRTVNACEVSEFQRASTPDCAVSEWEREEFGRWV